MWQLYQFSLCPFSRKVRLLLSEKGQDFELVREHPWDRRKEFLEMNRTGQTPVMTDAARGIVLVDSRAICEYLEETCRRMPMIMGTANDHAEIRRIVANFDECFFREVTAPLLRERVLKPRSANRPADREATHTAIRLADEHLDNIDSLIDNRRWLAGTSMSLADLAVAAQLSVADYLGAIDWSGHQQSHGWYSVMKSRPSFRPLLVDCMEGVEPPPHYRDVDA